MIPAGGSYKRSLCKFWQEGRCERGQNCTWSHGDEMAPPVGHGDFQVWQGQAPKKRTLCKFFQLGTCEKGDLCTWAHGPEEIGAPAALAVEAGLEGAAEPVEDREDVQAVEELQALDQEVLEELEHHLEEDPEEGAFAPDPENAEQLKPSTAPGKGGSLPWRQGGKPMGKGAAKGMFKAASAAFGAQYSKAAHGGFAPAARGPAGGGGAVDLGQTKRTMCRFWQQGACTRGDRCTFAHGWEDVGPIGPQMVHREPPPRWEPERFEPVHWNPPPRSNPSWAGTGSMRQQGGSWPSAGVREALPGPGPGPGPAVGAPAATKRTLCKFWMQGICNNGDTCTWAHGEQELGAPVFGDFDYGPGPCNRGMGPPAPTLAMRGPAGGSWWDMPMAPRMERWQPPPQPQPQPQPQLHLQEPLAGPTGVKRTLCKFYQQGLCERGSQCTWAHGEHEIGRESRLGGPAGFEKGRPAGKGAATWDGWGQGPPGKRPRLY